MVPVWEVALRARAAGAGADAEAARLELSELEALRAQLVQLANCQTAALDVLAHAGEFRRLLDLVDAVRRALTT